MTAVPNLISVVMPCHNAAPYVEMAVRSAFEQLGVNVELIVVDDASTDESHAILQRLAKEFGPRLKLLRAEGVGAFPARNRALREVTGDFIAFLDADDYWAPSCLQDLLGALVSSGSDIAYCGWQNVGNARNNKPFVPPDYAAGDPVAAFLASCPWPIHAALVHRPVIDAVEGFSERHFSAMDYDLWLRILNHTQRMVRVPKVLAFYRWHGGGQISSVKWRQVLHAWHVRRDFVSAFPARVRHIPSRRLHELVDGPVLKAGFEAYWRRDLASAWRLFRLALPARCWHARQLPYLLPALLPEAAFRRVVIAIDRWRSPRVSG